MFHPIYDKNGSVLKYFKVYSFTGNRIKDKTPDILKARVRYKNTLKGQWYEVIETWEKNGLKSMKYMGNQPIEVREALWNHLWEHNNNARLRLIGVAFWDWETA
ncbi:hypothetical protein COL23_25625 [Priestia aryabhattai]|uniref:hypothetical protein n=1 Tax=Priestia aryabhattai TaxID=412384 RepID=UPI000BF66496|nr:hypothetical protein [Priestia aryabhattai]PFW72133.1 hypothetical protein COL23_25625 [Priestia aryabhattai]